MIKYFILVGNEREFENCLRLGSGVSRNECKWVKNIADIAGNKDGQLICYGTYYANKESDKIIEYAKTHNIKIIAVSNHVGCVGC